MAPHAGVADPAQVLAAAEAQRAQVVARGGDGAERVLERVRHADLRVQLERLAVVDAGVHDALERDVPAVDHRVEPPPVQIPAGGTQRDARRHRRLRLALEVARARAERGGERER